MEEQGWGEEAAFIGNPFSSESGANHEGLESEHLPTPPECRLPIGGAANR